MKITIPTLEVRSMTVKLPDLPKVSMPKIELPKFPEVKLPKIDNPFEQKPKSNVTASSSVSKFLAEEVLPHM